MNNPPGQYFTTLRPTKLWLWAASSPNNVYGRAPPPGQQPPRPGNFSRGPPGNMNQPPRGNFGPPGPGNFGRGPPGQQPPPSNYGRGPPSSSGPPGGNSYGAARPPMVGNISQPPRPGNFSNPPPQSGNFGRGPPPPSSNTAPLVQLGKRGQPPRLEDLVEALHGWSSVSRTWSSNPAPFGATGRGPPPSART